MNQIAYLFSWPVDRPNGVERKIFDQVSSWVQAGYDVKCFAVGSNAPYREWPCPVSVFGGNPKAHFLKPFARIQQWYAVNQELNQFQPDVIYLRQQSYFPFLRKCIRSAPSVIELNAIDLGEAKTHENSGFSHRLVDVWVRSTRGLLFRECDGFVGVTTQMLEWEGYGKFQKPSQVVPNSIRLDDYSTSKVPTNKVPRFILVGTGGKKRPEDHWQGVDQIVEVATRYEGKAEFSLIGNDLCGDLALPSNVRNHGWCDLKEMSKIFDECDVAFGAIADFRRGMTETSSLKARQALAFGLPIVFAGDESMFFRYGKRLPSWALRMPNHSGALLERFDEILDFAEGWMGKRVAKEEVASFIDCGSLERVRLAFMEDIVLKNNENSPSS